MIVGNEIEFELNIELYGELISNLVDTKLLQTERKCIIILI